MSTTFEVYPGNKYIPTFEELNTVVTSNLTAYLNRYNIFQSIHLKVDLYTLENYSEPSFDQNDKMSWSTDHYAWFGINNIAGGTDCYFHKHSDLDKEIWKDELRLRARNSEIRELIINSLRLGYYWSFRRSVGQSGTIALLYGLLAGSLAQLTGGFIYSDDGAWNYKLFPARADDFLKYYFHPELATNERDKEFSVNCINSIVDEI